MAVLLEYGDWFEKFSRREKNLRIRDFAESDKI